MLWFAGLYSSQGRLFFFKPSGYVYWFEREREREISMWERNIHWLLPMHTSTGDWTPNLGMCLDWELNLPPFGVWENTLTNWVTGAGTKKRLYLKSKVNKTSIRVPICYNETERQWNNSYKLKRETATNSQESYYQIKCHSFSRSKEKIIDTQGLIYCPWILAEEKIQTSLNNW